MGRARRHLTYANVVATLALVLAVGGGGVYAASKIGGKQIRKGAVRSKQIRNKQVKRQDLAGGAVNSRKVSNQSLTGKDVKENTFEIVPLAQDARTVNGIGARIVRFSLADPTSATQAVAEGGFNVLLSCSGGNSELQLSGSAPGDTGTVFDSGSGATQELDSGSPQSVSTGASTAGFATVRRVDGTISRLEFELRRLDDGFGGSSDCFLNGFLLSGR
ncbi:MAG: hypothetical protein ACRDKV_06310 [Solirubrobacterales bacterium]